MKTGYRRLLIAAGMIGLAMPAFAQPANLLAPLTGQTPVGQTPVGQTPVGQTPVGQTPVGQTPVGQTPVSQSAGGQPAGPEPPGGQPAGAEPAAEAYTGSQPFLAAALDDVAQRRWSAAEAALERSETFLLNGGIKSSMGVVISPSLAMPYIIQARASVAERDQVDALLAINKAISTMSVSARTFPPTAPAEVSPSPSSVGPVARRTRAARPVLMVTEALLPGHWRLAGWQYHWVPPDTSYRPVQTTPYIPSHYEYRGGAWIWVAGHYGDN